MTGNGVEFPFSRLVKAHTGVLSNRDVNKGGVIFPGYLANTATKDTIYTFYRKIVNRNDTIDISLPCIEGCTYRFVKIRE